MRKCIPIQHWSLINRNEISACAAFLLSEENGVPRRTHTNVRL